jgi:16S rRNA (cytosine1402-N4)-methyltransferase
MHIPVLLKETLELLNLRPGDQVIDGTVGLGGHAKEILKATAPNGRLLAFDRDPKQIQAARKNLSADAARTVFINDSYANLAPHAYAQGFVPVAAVFLDLGYCSIHVDNPERGFSFQTEGPLDMRYCPTNDLTAEFIINNWPEPELNRIFLIYGEEQNARKIARAIVNERKKKTFHITTELAEFIQTVVPRRGKIHPATKVFQALRLVVNDELGELKKVLPLALEVLKPGGRLAIISFHSLEDGIVKNFFKKQNNKTLKIINKNIVVPTKEEMEENPRSRSAKLRVAEKL